MLIRHRVAVMSSFQKCRTCREKSVRQIVTDYTVEMEHDGRAYEVTVQNAELFECESCRARSLTDSTRKKLGYALRKKAGLLLPDEIRDQRKRLGLNQEQLAKYLKVAKETVSRWETGGQIQQRPMDLLLRIFFGVPAVRLWLDNPNLICPNMSTNAIFLQAVSPTNLARLTPLTPGTISAAIGHESAISAAIDKIVKSIYGQVKEETPGFRLVDQRASMPPAIASRIKERLPS